MTTKSLLQRLHAIQSEINYIKKRPKEGLPYPYVAHDDVSEALRGLFTKHGVVCMATVHDERQEGNRCVLDVGLTYYNVDDKEDFLIQHIIGHGVDNQDKGPGKALSYCCKVGWLKMFMIPTGEKDIETEDIAQAWLEPGIIKEALGYIGSEDGEALFNLIHNLNDQEKISLHKEFNVNTRKKVTELIAPYRG